MVLNQAFIPPALISYNSSGSQKTIASSYEAVFTHSLKTDCVLSNCFLKKQGCIDALAAQTNVQLGAPPTFAITATELNPFGYSLTFCLDCVIIPT